MKQGKKDLQMRIITDVTYLAKEPQSEVECLL